MYTFQSIFLRIEMILKELKTKKVED